MGLKRSETDIERRDNMLSQPVNKSLDIVRFLLVVGCLVLIGAKEVAGDYSNHEPCPDGWILYSDELPIQCAWVSDYSVDSMWTAHKECIANDSSLMMIQSQTKYRFFKDIITGYQQEGVWLGLQRFDEVVTWLTKNGSVPATWFPEDWDDDIIHTNHLTDYYDYNPYAGHEYGSYNRGLMYRYRELDHSSYNIDAFFICELRPPCKAGWYGMTCQKECHCNGQQCYDTDEKMTCDYGCELGWTGDDCSQPKKDASVKYFCADSPDEGKFLFIRIETFGTMFQILQPLSEDGETTMSWCNATVDHNYHDNTTTIKVFVDDHFVEGIRNGNCPGRIVENKEYEWVIRTQEISGLVSRNDRDYRMKCDFNHAADMSLSNRKTIRKEKSFRSNDIRRRVKTIYEKQETVTLSVVNPVTFEPYDDPMKLGTPVVIKISFGEGEDDAAKGVIPYNCYATAGKSHANTMFINQFGCPTGDLPISGFNRKSSNAITTDPFQLFGFPGKDKIYFRCSYVLCFGEDPCHPWCPGNWIGGPSTTTTPWTTPHYWNSTYPNYSTSPSYPHNTTYPWPRASTTPHWRGKRSVGDVQQKVEESVQLSPP